MLKLFRQRQFLVRVLLFVIVGIVGVMMVITLVPGLGGDVSLRDPQGLLAQIGDAAVTQTQAQQRYQRTAEQLGTQAQALRPMIMERVVDDLVAQRVLEYEAARLGLNVTPAELSARLRQSTLFYPGGKFVGAETYRRIVSQQFGLTVPEFEAAVRGQALQRKLFLWVTGGLTVSPAEVEQEYRRRNDRAQIELALVRPESFFAAIRPTDADLRAYYEPNRQRYQLPERRAVRFVPVEYEVLRGRVVISPRELEAYYQSRRDTYQLPERVRARHIVFLRLPGEEAAAVRKRAEDVLAQLRRGKDFAALARQYSAHEQSRESGGDMGWVRRGQTVPELEQVLFSRRPGSPPELVETGYGVHLVQVLEYQAERLRPLAEVRPEIEGVLKEQKVRQTALEEAQRLVAAVRGGKSLEQAAREASWPVRESFFFTRDQPLQQFGAGPEFQEAAFRLPAQSGGKPDAPVSDPVTVPRGYSILQLKEVSPSHQGSFEEVRDKVLQAYLQEQGGQRAREAALRLAAEAQKTKNLRATAQRMDVPVFAPEKFGREGAGLGIPKEITAAAFTLPVGNISEALLVGGNWMVIRVVAREEADLSKLTPLDRKVISQSLLDNEQNLAWNVYTESVKKRLEAEGKLKLNQAAINRIIGKK